MLHVLARAERGPGTIQAVQDIGTRGHTRVGLTGDIILTFQS
jgi:hypothetical protein